MGIRHDDEHTHPSLEDRARRDLVVCAVACLAGIAALAFFQPFAGTVGSVAMSDGALNLVLAFALLAPLTAVAYTRRRVRHARRVEQVLTELSRFDPVTGLLNRRVLQERRVVRRGRESLGHPALIFIDLDGFKLVNDTHGHEAGDLLLAAVAERLAATVRAEDTVVRYGGDEFVVLCNDVVNEMAADRIAKRIIEALEAPVQVGRDRLRISASIGVALACSTESAMDELLARADRAMYQAKEKGPGSWEVSVTDDGVTLDEMSLERAYEERQFVLHYQPIVRLDTLEIVGAEALLRWNHPTYGLVPPGAFVPLLERSGLIVPLGEWILEQAATQASAWRAGAPDREGFRVAVNVSPRQLNQAGFADHARRAIERANCSPRGICLEITEGALVRDPDAAWSALRQLKLLGVELALDDFGTGYASLSYLRRFDLDTLKIDRSFVQGLGESEEDTTIVEHVIGLSHALGLVALAEGVEHEHQARKLEALGCDLVQGFALGRPMPAEDFERVLLTGLAPWPSDSLPRLRAPATA